MVRVLVAEDSVVTREYLVHLLEQDPAVRVAGTARDGLEALDQAERLRPNVILMDVHMPRMSGYEATRRVMESFPTPIVMMSASYGRKETAMTLEALKAGALTVVEKPTGPDHPEQAEGARKLVETVKLMAEVKVVRRWPRREAPAAAPAPPAAPHLPDRRIRVVAIGASAGGPAALEEVLGRLPAGLAAPILVVQHIAAGFSAGLAEWLGQRTRLAVKLAEAGEPLRGGTVHLAPEGRQMGATKEGRIRLADGPPEDGFRPSASYLFSSVAEAYGRSAMGVVLTGMGRDGAAGLLKLREAGGVTFAQEEDTCVVFGMPGEAIRVGAAEHVLSPRRIAEAIGALAAREE